MLAFAFSITTSAQLSQTFSDDSNILRRVEASSERVYKVQSVGKFSVIEMLVFSNRQQNRQF